MKGMLKMNVIKDITDFIFVGKNINELSYYDLLIINADWTEEQLAKDLRIMFNKNIIDKNTLFIICESHQPFDRSSANILIGYLKKENINNRVIIDNKYITNPEILQNKIENGSNISTDKRSNYKTVLKLFNVAEHNVYSANTVEAYKNLGNINSLHSRFKNFIRQLHGVSTRRLENYLVCFSWLENFKRNEDKNKLIVDSITNNRYETSIRDYPNTPYLFMEYWNNNQYGLT